MVEAAQCAADPVIEAAGPPARPAAKSDVSPKRPTVDEKADRLKRQELLEEVQAERCRRSRSWRDVGAM